MLSCCTWSIIGEGTVITVVKPVFSPLRTRSVIVGRIYDAETHFTYIHMHIKWRTKSKIKCMQMVQSYIHECSVSMTVTIIIPETASWCPNSLSSLLSNYNLGYKLIPIDILLGCMEERVDWKENIYICITMIMLFHKHIEQFCEKRLQVWEEKIGPM